MSNEEEAQLQSAPTVLPPAEKKKRLIISAVIILIGAIMVAVSSALYAPFTAPAEFIKIADDQNIGAVLETGESGTTLTIFGCNTAPCVEPFADCDDSCKTVDKLKTVECESQGVDANTTKADIEQFTEKIEDCLEEGAKGYPKDVVPLTFIIPDDTTHIFKGTIKSNFSEFQFLEEEGKDIKPVDIIGGSMNGKLYREITEEVKFRAMTPAVPWLVILVIGVFVIVGGISYLHMTCDQSKLPDE